MNQIIFYTTHCPKCQVLKAKLDSLNISYFVQEDINVMENMGMMTVPMLQVGNNLLTFSQAVKWLKEYEKNEH